MEYGKLWNYNLLYFDYLNQPDVELEKKLYLIRHFLQEFEDIQFARDPYPVSLRCINWIKFLINNSVHDQEIEQAVYRQYYILMDNIEYHLLGNHLFENGCSLLIGGIYFDDDALLQKACSILKEQLEEQILQDGGHFERSPMYHQLLLYRLMDCYNFIISGSFHNDKIRQRLKQSIEKMLGWLAEITFNDGTVPHVNDATGGIAPTTAQINQYANYLNLNTTAATLSNSGYRMIRQDNYEWLIDVGDIGPDYIPGHAHSDTFSFVLHINEKPVIVDTGISTYEECDRRLKERSTSAHNTVMINGVEQTEVWKSFRVGRRAHITEYTETDNSITAAHDGYRHMGIKHRRIFRWKQKELYIRDEINGKADGNALAFLHFHPGIDIKKEGNKVIAGNTVISFTGYKNIQIRSYRYAVGFNRLKPASVLEIRFSDSLETGIKL